MSLTTRSRLPPQPGFSVVDELDWRAADPCFASSLGAREQCGLTGDGVGVAAVDGEGFGGAASAKAVERCLLGARVDEAWSWESRNANQRPSSRPPRSISWSASRFRVVRKSWASSMTMASKRASPESDAATSAYSGRSSSKTASSLGSNFARARLRTGRLRGPRGSGGGGFGRRARPRSLRRRQRL